MKEQHKRDNSPKHYIGSKEGQRNLLCCNKGIIRCPSLEYVFSSINEENLNKAYDILFEEVFKRQ